MSTSPRVRAALSRADDIVATPHAARAAPPGAPVLDGIRPRIVALGDPQAAAARVFTVLDRHGLLGEDGWLAADVHLVSMGDHLDWGDRDAREAARQDGARLLAWCGAQDPAQVTMLAGNHDLSRVGELAGFDDVRFTAAQAVADAAHAAGAAAEAAFLARYPTVPSAECIARDFSSFSTLQQEWVRVLLQRNRLVVAASHGDILLSHAGVSRDELDAIGLDDAAQRDAGHTAAALQRVLRGALDTWDGAAPLALPVLHQPGNAAGGEGRGLFYHRPCQPRPDDEFLSDTAPPRRRFDARRLPRGLTQAIGHIRDGKCRTLLGDWCDDASAIDGPLRSLVVRDAGIRYTRGLQPPAGSDTATVLFLDGGLFHADLDRYELLDLVRRAPAECTP